MVEISKETFNELVQNPNKITLDQSIALKNIVKKYPFFQVARVIELIGLKNLIIFVIKMHLKRLLFIQQVELIYLRLWRKKK